MLSRFFESLSNASSNRKHQPATHLKFGRKSTKVVQTEQEGILKNAIEPHIVGVLLPDPSSELVPNRSNVSTPCVYSSVMIKTLASWKAGTGLQAMSAGNFA